MATVSTYAQAGTDPMTAQPRLRRRQWQPGRLLDNYGLVLVLLVGVLVMLPAADDAIWRVVLLLLLLGALLATYRASGVSRRTIAIVTAVAVATTIPALIAAVVGDTYVDGWQLVPELVLLVAGPGVIIHRVFAHRSVGVSTILGALCAYIYIGLIFAIAFGLVEAIGTEPVFKQDSDPAAGTYSYFSFVTLTTLGYGDLSPATSVGQRLAMLEALTGSIYLVTLVGRLVGLYGNPLRSEPSSSRSDKDDSPPLPQA